MQSDFIQIIDQHQNIIHKVSRMYRDNIQDQEDLFQEIVFQLWKAYPAFRKESKVSTWMYRIALNTAMAVFRKKQAILQFQDALPESVHPSTSEEISENEERMYLGLRQLNTAERAIISLYLEDYNYNEIAGILGITENNVGVRINRIKNKLKEIFKKA